MAIKKTERGWRVDEQPGGRGSRRIRKTFKTKAEAQRFQNFIRRQADEGKEWAPPKKDLRRLTDIADRWHQIQGQTIKTGARRLHILRTTAEKLGNPRATDFTAEDWIAYRNDRLDTVAPATLNREHAYLSAAFSALIKAGEWTQENPLRRTAKLREKPQELNWLTRAEIAQLLKAARASRNQSLAPCLRLALATGARWGEAEAVRAEHIGNDRVTFPDTKGGRARTVPISAGMAASLQKRGPGRIFAPCYGAMRKALKRAGLELPPGQAAHVTRHTFAAHFVMGGGHILTLQRILGHASLDMTLRYAHLAPEYLEEARRLNPLRQSR